VFRDITPLLLDPAALDLAVSGLVDWVRPRDVDLVVAAEARGFILGGAVARQLGAGFVPARKPGKLPHETVSAEYILEYGIDALEMHADALADGTRVLVHDDLLATGGTARALCELVEGAGGVVVGCAFLVELSFLAGREALAGYDVHSLISYDTE
jgi:adenine phosphoribosyltransferase